MVSKKIAGVRVDFGLEVSDVLAKIDEFVRSESSHFLFTINPEFIMKAQKDIELLRALNSSDLSVPDGAGLLFAKKYLDGISHLHRSPLFSLKAFIYGTGMGFGSLFKKEPFGNRDRRLSGSDLIYDICGHAEKNGQTVFLLGGWEKDPLGRMKRHHGNIADKAAQRMKKDFPRLQIIGATSDFSHRKSDDARGLGFIKESMTKAGVDHIDILFVFFTSGEPEKF